MPTLAADRSGERGRTGPCGELHLQRGGRGLGKTGDDAAPASTRRAGAQHINEAQLLRALGDGGAACALAMRCRRCRRLAGVHRVVDVPARTVQLLHRFLAQNNSVLSKRARTDEFAALTDDDVTRVEQLYRQQFMERCSDRPRAGLSRRPISAASASVGASPPALQPTSVDRVHENDWIMLVGT
jgi:hypothetical protein